MISSQFQLMISEGHYVVVFDMTSMQDATESCQYPELVEEPPQTGA